MSGLFIILAMIAFFLAVGAYIVGAMSVVTIALMAVVGFLFLGVIAVLFEGNEY